MSHILDILQNSLESNTYFTHTDSLTAEAYLAGLSDRPLDKVSIAITGDDDITNGRQVTECINMMLRMFSRPENVRIVTGESTGVESIVRRWAKKNQFELDVFSIVERPEWGTYDISEREERDRRMVESSQCVIVVNKTGSKGSSYLYTLAVESGRLVSKRLIRNKKV